MSEELRIMKPEESQKWRNAYPDKGRLTNHQLAKLSEPGRRLEEYWRKYLPKMYNSLADQGELHETVMAESYRLFEMMLRLMRQGLHEDQAWEVVNAEIYGTPAET